MSEQAAAGAYISHVAGRIGRRGRDPVHPVPHPEREQPGAQAPAPREGPQLPRDARAHRPHAEPTVSDFCLTSIFFSAARLSPNVHKYGRVSLCNNVRPSRRMCAAFRVGVQWESRFRHGSKIFRSSL